jgi:hypothetical protein
MSHAEYRAGVLGYLKKMGFVGISDFMYATMTSLIPKAPEPLTQQQRQGITRKRRSGMRATAAAAVGGGGAA